jgi:hypothetical protein
MVRDEAPAATIGGFNERECDRAEIGPADQAGSIPGNGPTSLVAAEIHLGRKPAGICDGWLHCNIQVACHADSKERLCEIKGLPDRLGTQEQPSPLISGRWPKY